MVLGRFSSFLTFVSPMSKNELKYSKATVIFFKKRKISQTWQKCNIMQTMISKS